VPTKQTLIMIHGFRGTHHGLLLIANRLKGTRLVVPDLPGFGKGEKMPTYDLDNYVMWLHRYIKALKLTESPILFGHSFGSIICAAYAAKYPKDLKRLILVNPIGSPALEGPSKTMTKLAIAYYKIGARLPEKTAYRWLSAQPIVKVMSVTMAKTHNKELRAYIHQQHRQHFSRFSSAQSVLESFKTSVSHDVREFAPKIKIPTLLVAGSLDDITPLGKQYALVKLFPKATLRVINDVGHLTHYEAPEQVAKYVQAFIKSA
jgi:pimeloyl-ACP methyl ester carboxylesterase